MAFMETRNTVQRSLVLNAVQHLFHPTADEVYEYICADHPTVSRGTVYRNLHLLVELGRMRRVPVADGADRFDKTLSAHYHIRCRVCGLVSDVDMPYQKELLNSVLDAHGFLIEEHDILLKGVCPQCRQLRENATGYSESIFK